MRLSGRGGYDIMGSPKSRRDRYDITGKNHQAPKGKRLVEEFAEKLYVSRQAVSRWENGSALPDAQNILQISKLFHASTDYLLNDDYDSDGDIPAVRTAEEKADSLSAKNKRRHLAAAVSFTFASLCWAAGTALCTNETAKILLAFTLFLNAGNAAVHFVLYFKKR